MSLAPLLEAPAHIQIHAYGAALAVVLGPLVIYRPRRDRLHKVLGYTWVVAMALTALSSFAITNFGLIGPFSPIHLLSILALWSLWIGMRHAIAGRICAHKATLRSLYWNGLIVAGAFNFLPGRTLNRMAFNDMRELGYVVIAIALAMILGRIARGRIHAQAVAA